MVKNGVQAVHPGEILREDYLAPLETTTLWFAWTKRRTAMRLMAEKTRVIAEGAGDLSAAAALTGKAGEGPVVAIVSGGNVDLPDNFLFSSVLLFGIGSRRKGCLQTQVLREPR